MSRQLALGGQPLVVARWSEALAVALERSRINRLLLVEPRPDPEVLDPLVRAVAERGCALIVCLGPGAERVQRLVDGVCDALSAPGQVVATSWHDPAGEPDAGLEAFSLFSTWVGGEPGVPLLVADDNGLDQILEAARRLHPPSGPGMG